MCEYLKALQRPFPAEDIEWRVSHAVKTANGCKALVLAYVTNRAIQERLDEVFGIAGWKNEYSEWRQKGVLCTISCKVENEWISKSDGADETDMEATKGGFSASMKRAAVQWGIGRYLYNIDQTWVEVKERGQNYISTSVGPKDRKEFIKGYWDTPKLPAWALPEGYEVKEGRPQEPHIEQSDLPEPPPEEAKPNKPSSVQGGLNAKSRVMTLKTTMKWDWNTLGEFATDVLGRTIKKVITDIKTEEEWKKVEEAMLITKQAS